MNKKTKQSKQKKLIYKYHSVAIRWWESSAGTLVHRLLGHSVESRGCESGCSGHGSGSGRQDKNRYDPQENTRTKSDFISTSLQYIVIILSNFIGIYQSWSGLQEKPGPESNLIST